MARFSNLPYPHIDLEAAASVIFRLFSVVGGDTFTRNDAAKFLGESIRDPRFSSMVFPSLHSFGLITYEQQGHRIIYRISESGRLLAFMALQRNPELADEPMTPAGRAYLDRRLSEISTELARLDSADASTQDQ